MCIADGSYLIVLTGNLNRTAYRARFLYGLRIQLTNTKLNLGAKLKYYL